MSKGRCTCIYVYIIHVLLNKTISEHEGDLPQIVLTVKKIEACKATS